MVVGQFRCGGGCEAVRRIAPTDRTPPLGPHGTRPGPAPGPCVGTEGTRRHTGPGTGPRTGPSSALGTGWLAQAPLTVDLLHGGEAPVHVQEGPVFRPKDRMGTRFGREAGVRYVAQPGGTVHVELGEGEQQGGQGDGRGGIFEGFEVGEEVSDEDLGGGEDLRAGGSGGGEGAPVVQIGPQLEEVAGTCGGGGLGDDLEADHEQQPPFNFDQFGDLKMREIGRAEGPNFVDF